MRERAALLNLVTELRGRLDELESLIRTAPNQAVLTPASYDEDGVADLTPVGYSDFRVIGLDGTKDLSRYEPFMNFTQLGVPEGAPAIEISAFELSDLHKTSPEPAWGLRFTPKDTAAQTWFTYEILNDGAGLAQYQWLEWVLKLSMAEPTKCFVQFIVETKETSARIDIGMVPVSDFASFCHIRLDRAQLMDASGGHPIRRVRLTFSTGGKPIPLEIFALSLFGRA